MQRPNTWAELSFFACGNVHPPNNFIGRMKIQQKAQRLEQNALCASPNCCTTTKISQLTKLPKFNVEELFTEFQIFLKCFGKDNASSSPPAHYITSVDTVFMHL